MTISRDLSIVIPTITGRESWLQHCYREYRRLAPNSEIIVIKDAVSCGVAWQQGFAQSTRQLVHFTADDLTPFRGWWQEASVCLQEGNIPAANVLDKKGGKLVCDSPLGDMGGWPNILVPFLNRELLLDGEWLLPIHYGSDDWITYKAVSQGYKVVRCMDYKFTHHVAPEGRNYLRRYGDVANLAAAMKAAGYLPPVYEQLEINLRASKTGLDSVSLGELSARDQEIHIRREPVPSMPALVRVPA